MDEFIKEVLEEEDLQTVVARYCTEDFEHSGARPNSLITGAAAALAMGNGGEIISTEEIINGHNADHRDLRIPINRVTRSIPSGVMQRIADTMVSRQWQFNEFMGNFGNFSIMYASIAVSISISAGFNVMALLCAFLAMLVLSQGMRYTTERGRDGRVNQRRLAMTANWATPDPQPDKTLIDNWRRNDDKQQTRNEYIIRQTHWFEPDDVTDSSGYMPYAGSNALQTRVEIEGRPIMIGHGLHGTENYHETREDQPFLVFRGNPPQPVETDTTNVIRCLAIKRNNGKRCVNCLHKGNNTGFCGLHKKWPTNGGEVAGNDWAVDLLSGTGNTEGPSRAVETDKSNLKF